MIPRHEPSNAMTEPLPPAPLPAGALLAFLRGIERRAAVLAELQCGSAVAGDAALVAAMRAFHGAAARVPMAQWPQRFWALLLAAPQLRRCAAASTWPPDWQALAALGNGPRAALLLRLVAGLDVETAAAALAVSPERYRQALARAVAVPAGETGADAWQPLAAATQRQLRQLPAQRLMQLAQLRERALGGAASPPSSRIVRRSRGRRALWAGVLACAVALAATFWPGLDPGLSMSELWPALLRRSGTDGASPIRREALPAAEPPAARFDADFAAATHRDFVLLADPDGLRQAQSLAMLAWYAAERAAARPADAVPLALADAFAVAPTPWTPAAGGGALPAHAVAQLQALPAALRTPLRAQWATWAGYDHARRAAHAARRQRWEALPLAERGNQREQYAAWRELPATARLQVASAGSAFAALSLPEQQALRARFAALDTSSQRGWLLGPDLGADYPRLQPLLAQLPARQRAPLLETLRGMSAAERADLAVLAQRVPPQERDALRRMLLSTAAGNRSAWLRMRLEQ